MKKRQKFSFSVIAVLTLLALFFLNCSPTQFINLAPVTVAPVKVSGATVDSPFLGPIASDSGNGGTYDGKLRILHRYVKDFRCEGRPQPESILIRKNASDWVIIRNAPTRCHIVDQAPVTGVAYDDVAKVANYGGQIFVAPKPYLVAALEDPNLPDINLIDGVCEDLNGRCSLLAATQQAGITASTIPVQVEIPPGHYKLTGVLDLSFLNTANAVTISGADKVSTIIDGQNSTHHFIVSGGGPETLFQNLSLINGNNGTAKQSSSITTVNYIASSYFGKLTIDNCLFKNNLNNPPLFIPVIIDGLTVRKSQFVANSEDAIHTAGNRIVIEDSSFSSNGGDGLSANSGYSTVLVKNSSFDNNAGRGLNLSQCAKCLIENSTIYNNQGSGLSISTAPLISTSDFNFTINNTTIYNNATVSGASLQLSFADSANYLTINNTVLAIHDPVKFNCTFDGFSSHNILAANSLFDDSSCAASGAGNLTGDPMLGAFALNGGFTPTLIPSLGSPLVDAGNTLTCASTDQRWLPRPAGPSAKCDIGAVEIQ